MITVNTNMSSIIAQNSLYKSTNKMNTALQRLSTGLRINSAKDDAAGSAISTKLEYKVSSYDIAKDNAQMGQSMLDTANGTLSQINSMLQRIRDLSEQASNGTYGKDERKAMQAEIDGLTEEIYRIKNTTEFNGKKIFGEYEEYVEPEEPKEVVRTTEAEAIARGYTVVKTAKEFQAAYFKEKTGGDYDIVDGVYKYVGRGNGSYSQKVNDKNCKVMLFADIDLNDLGDLDGNGSNWIPIGINSGSVYGTLNGNNYTISNLKINKPTDQSFGGLFDYFSGSIRNINLKNIDITGYSNFGGVFNNICNSTINNCHISGTLTNTARDYTNYGGLAFNINTKSNIKDVTVFVKINSKLIDKGGAISRYEGSYGASTFDNVKYDSQLNPGMKALGNRTTTPEGIIDISEGSSGGDMSVKTNLQVGINSDDNSTVSVDTGFALGDFSVSVYEESDARKSLDKIDKLMTTISQKMTDIGSAQNRLESIMEFQDVQVNALTSANSLIKDADIALESANYLKNQILQNVTSALLSTANQSPQIALQLI